uniref:Dehydrogenase/reductase SDR family member 1 n=1 Tax=Plectus sambesii TaxID=2011161 RepID=A0A914UM67_9BILA
MSLKGKVALVTGASRGIGRGIALQLGTAGAIVYITGRRPAGDEDSFRRPREEHDDSLRPEHDGPFAESPLQVCAQDITERGGLGIAVFCDHSNPVEVENLFERIKKEQDGRLDILVNNAYAAVDDLVKEVGKKFYEMDPDSGWDKINNVGLKNHFVCSTYAARLMVPRGSGLIVTVSSYGGMNHAFGVCYGVGKAACDRLAADMAIELEGSGVTSVAIWPGPVKTEYIQSNIITENDETGMKKHFENGETVEFVGKCVVALAADPNMLSKSGRVMMTDEIAEEYHITEEDGLSKLILLQ